MTQSPTTPVPYLAAIPTPSFDQDLSLFERVEDLSVQELIPQLADEGLDVAVLPRTARCDEECCPGFIPRILSVPRPRCAFFPSLRMPNFLPDKKQLRNDVLIVLGMHRSGTSCLTGMLQQAGLVLGDVVEEAPFNRKGNRENLEIRELNDAILANSGGAWDSPPNHLTWRKEHQYKRDAIIEQHRDQAAWGFKDPRTMFTLPFWQEGLKGANLHYIATFRNPLSVAKSLNSRQPELSIEKGAELWRRYNEQLLDYQWRYGFPVVNFDLDSEPYLHSVFSAIQRLDMLPAPADKWPDFFENALRPQNSLEASELQRYAHALDPVMPIFEKLQALA